jgi:HK97 family phage portal protein
MRTGFFSGLMAPIETRASYQGDGSLQSPQDWVLRLFGLGSTQFENVNEQTSMQLGPVYGCVKAISDDLSSLPFKVYRRLDARNREELDEHPVTTLLDLEPNPEMSAKVFRETLQGHVLLWGNAYCAIERTNRGTPIALWPIEPDRVVVSRVNSEILYTINGGRKTTVLGADDVLHVRNIGYNGIIGYSTVRLARMAIGLGMAAEKFGAGFFEGGARPAGILKTPNKLTAEAIKNLRDSWHAVHGGANNGNKTAVLEGGVEYQAMSIPPEDAQFILTRQFQVPEICRFFRVPPHKIQHLDRATFSNIEHQSIDYVKDALLGHAVRWEQEAWRKLLNRDPRLRVRHNLDAMLRGDLKSRAESYAIGRQWGWLSVNDIRGREDMDAIDNGDEYMRPLNMVPVGTPAASPDEPPADPPPEPDPAARGARAAAMLRTLAKPLADAYRRRARIAKDRGTRGKPDPDFWVGHADGVRGDIFGFAELAVAVLAQHTDDPGVTAADLSRSWTGEYMQWAELVAAGTATDDACDLIVKGQLDKLVGLATAGPGGKEAA